MMERIKEAFRYHAFLGQLVYQQLDQRYHGSFLGFLWTLLYPLMIFCSFTLIFSVLNNWDLRDFGIYFLSGYLFWMLFSSACMLGAESVVGNAVYVTRVCVPNLLLPLSSVVLSLVDFAAGLGILCALMLAAGAPFTSAMLFLPVSIVLAVIFVTGSALLCAVANVFFRDFRHILSSFLFVWFFFSPILWKPEAAPPGARIFVWLNPVVPFLEAFQAPIWRGRLPAAESLTAGAVFALALLLLGLAVFLRAERRFYFYL